MVDLNETFHLGQYQDAVDEGMAEMAGSAIISRIWAQDYTVWKPQPDQITNRLGWLEAPKEMLEAVGRLRALRDSVVADRFERVLWLGMGGSSLAPDVYSRIFGVTEGGLPVEVLDSTAPGAVLDAAGRIDPARTLFVVATKSGTTAETLSFFKFFYNRVVEAAGEKRAGQHFIAITDEGTHLDNLAQQLGFRDIFRNNPRIGGRYSALSFFGMVAAALLNMDLEKFLQRAVDLAEACHVPDNPAARLGSFMGVLATQGRDKLTLIASPTLEPFGDWVEQLIAETTGKEGKGILPVVGEPPAAPEAYGADRLFVDLRLAGDTTHEAAVNTLVEAGEPVVQYVLADEYDLGAHLFLWELATAVAGYYLQINPFNQPNVESAKRRAREMMDAYREQGALPALDPALEDEGITVYGDITVATAGETLAAFAGLAEPGGYLALQAYVPPTGETTATLREMQALLRARTGLAVTVGYGPRFLHSTGQLHKGDAGRGLFVQLLGGDGRDAPIPDEPGSDTSSITFGVLKRAQALGDRQALLDAGRRVLTLDLGDDVPGGLERLLDALR